MQEERISARNKKQMCKFYIAYGSNLNLNQMKHRCPTATVAGKTTLEGYRLRFRGYPHSAYATVEPAKDCSVPVLIWKIKAQDETFLDKYEGFPSHYRKETLPVTLNGKTVNAMIYIMNERFPYNQPSKSYYDIVAEGYNDSGFGIEYLDKAVSANLALKNAEAEETPTHETSSENSPPDDREDKFLTPTIREQIMAIRDSGETNMFAIRNVQYLAYQQDFYELVCFIEDHRDKYVRFIMTGEES